MWQLRKYRLVIAAITVGAIAAVVSGTSNGGSTGSGYDNTQCSSTTCKELYSSCLDQAEEFCTGEGCNGAL